MNKAYFLFLETGGVCLQYWESVEMTTEELTKSKKKLDNDCCPQRSPLSLADNGSRLCNFTARPVSASAV